MDNQYRKTGPNYPYATWPARLEGYLLIPHELLHLAGYKLMGKRCRYRWGDRYVTPLDPMTREEHLFGLLFPCGVCLFLGLIVLPLPIVAFLTGSLGWAIALHAIFALPFIYAFAALGDLRQAYLLIFNKPRRSKTPFDFFFWPLLADPKVVQVSALVVIGTIVVSYLIYFLFF